MSSKTYDILKYLQRIAIPALFAFLSAVLPRIGVDEGVVNDIAFIGGAFITLFGALMQGEYNKWKAQQEEGNG